jgi:hypothetical protein
MASIITPLLLNNTSKRIIGVKDMKYKSRILNLFFFFLYIKKMAAIIPINPAYGRIPQCLGK